jgi:hypothetical protein
MSESVERSPTVLPVVLAAALLPAAAAGLVLFCFDPSRYHFYPVCFFHKTTGLLCAGCGALRAMHQLLHGHLVTAFRFNPLLVVSLPFFLWFGVKGVAQKARNQPVALGIRPVWWWLLLGVLIGFTLLRNLPGLQWAMLPP